MPDPYPTEPGGVRVSRDVTAERDTTIKRDLTVEREPAVDRDVSQASVGELISEVTQDLSTLLRQELELAKAEIRAEAAKAGKGVGMLGGAGYAGHLATLFVSFTVMFGLSALIDSLTWAALIVAVIWAVVGAVLYFQGREQMRRVHPKPEQTVETLKEEVQWAKNRAR
jgi:ABC-type multidrug transport system fused ATPase/permease subunit